MAFPVLSALEAGYDVYVVDDTCGAADRATHDAALQRMAQAGAVLVSWIDVMCEWQRAADRTRERVAYCTRWPEWRLSPLSFLSKRPAAMPVVTFLRINAWPSD